MSPSDRRPGSPLSYSHLRIYREIANGTTGAFMAPTDVGSLLDEIERLESVLDRYRSAATTSATMEGLQYRGLSNSAYKQAWLADRAALSAGEGSDA